MIDINPPLPDDFPIITEATLEALDLHEDNLAALGLEMESLVNFITLLETKPSDAILKYALEKYELTDIISAEDINKSAQLTWDRTKLNLRRYQSELFSYAKIIQSGADRAVERLEMLYGMADKTQRDPYDEFVTIKKNERYCIDGQFEPNDIRPLLEQSQNCFDFYDKVLINYMQDVDKVILKVELDHTWTDETLMKFERFSAKRWMSHYIDVSEDTRFRSGSNVTRTAIAQGNRAIYFAGPTDTKTEDIKDWNFLINTIRNFRLKYLKVPEMKVANPDNNQVKVGNPNAIKQRISYIAGVAKRIKGRVGYDKKISAELRKLEADCEKLRNQSRGLRTQLNKNTGEEKKDPGRPVVSDVVKDLTMIMTSMTRLVTDFNNCLAGQLRLVGVLGYVTDLELKAYEAPIKKPTKAIEEKTEV